MIQVNQQPRSINVIGYAGNALRFTLRFSSPPPLIGVTVSLGGQPVSDLAPALTTSGNDVQVGFTAQQMRAMALKPHWLEISWGDLVRLAGNINAYKEGRNIAMQVIAVDLTNPAVSLLLDYEVASALAARSDAQFAADQAESSADLAQTKALIAQQQATIATQAATLAQQVAASLGIDFAYVADIAAAKALAVTRTTLVIVANDVDGNETDAWFIRTPDNKCKKILTQSV